MKYSIDMILNWDIEQLRNGAVENNDRELVEACDRALHENDPEAWDKCIETLNAS